MVMTRTVGPFEVASLLRHIVYTPEPVEDGDEKYAVTIKFPLPRAERICVDGYDGRAIPSVEVVPESTGVTRHWYFGGRDPLPKAVNGQVESLVRTAMEEEHRQAGWAMELPVPDDVVARYRAVDPDISVTDVRRAVRIYRDMAEAVAGASERTAAWIAQNFRTMAENEEDVEVAREEARDDGVAEGKEEAQREYESKPVKLDPEDQETIDRAQLVLDTVERLQSGGASILAFRPGKTELEKFLDAIDAA